MLSGQFGRIDDAQKIHDKAGTHIEGQCIPEVEKDLIARGLHDQPVKDLILILVANAIVAPGGVLDLVARMPQGLQYTGEFFSCQFGGQRFQHSLDPQGGVDLAEVKRLVGDQVCLIGNVNCALLQTGSDAEAADDVRRALAQGMPRGGYVFGTSNCIYTGMSLERYDLMLDIWRTEGNYT